MSLIRKKINGFQRQMFLKCIGYLSLGALVVFTVPDTSFARVLRVFGPEDFIRSGSGPAAEVVEFQVQSPNDSEFNLHVFYGGLKQDFQGIVPSAVVTLNGRTVVTPDEFNRNIHYIKKPVTLLEENSLSVELRGKPGSGVRVVITGKNDESQLFDFNKIVQPDGIGLLGPDLNYGWTIVAQTEGGNAALSDPLSSSPSLTVDRPGEYSMLLTIRGGTWEESFPIKLTAIEYPTAIPVHVQTRVISGTGDQYQDYSIKVGPHTYTAPAPTSCGSPSYEGFQVLVLNRASLEFKDHRTFNMPCGRQAMTTFLTGLDNTSFVVISSLKGAEPFEVCDAFCTLGTVFQTLGGSGVYFLNHFLSLSYTLPDGTPVPFSYSLIGIPGVGSYEGTEMNSWDHRAYRQESKIKSNISGYFVLDDTLDHRTFVYPEFIEIETRAHPTATSNTIKVGGSSYASRPLMAGAAGGFQVLILDQDTLQPSPILGVNNMTFSTNAGTGTGSVSESEQISMSNFLAFLPEMVSEYNQRLLVVISSIGTPIGYKSPTFSELARIIGWYYGGATGVFLRLGTTSDAISTYSLVGPIRNLDTFNGPGALDSIEATSTQASQEKEDLRVVMHKDNQGWFGAATTYAGDAAAASSPDFSLLAIAFQPPASWPLPDPSDPLYQEQVYAYQYISNSLGVNAYGDIRSLYTAQNLILPAYASCVLMAYPSPPPSPYFRPEVFTAMRSQLCNEFNYVNYVNGFKGDMHDLLADMQVSTGNELDVVYNAVKSTVFIENTDKVAWDILYVIRGVLMVGTAVAPAPALKVTLGAMNAVMFLGMNLSKGPGGPDYTSVDTEYQNLRAQMNNLWTNCQTGKDIILDIVKSDWGKLQYVGNKLTTAQTNGGWMYGDTDPDTWKKIVTDALEAYYFQSLIPGAGWKIDYLSDSSTIPAPANFWYDAGPWPCAPYCDGSSDNPTAYWVDSFLDGRYTWYLLENGLHESYYCGSVNFSSSTTLRDILFGSGDWKDSSGNKIGVKLNLSMPFFYERWLPSSAYQPPTMPEFGEVIGYNHSCND